MYEDVYKPLGKMSGVDQMSTILIMKYVYIGGEGNIIAKNSVNDVCARPDCIFHLIVPSYIHTAAKV